MSKATETADITISTGLLVLMGMISISGVFASASPAVAPSTADSSISISNEYSAVMTANVSGGSLRK